MVDAQQVAGYVRSLGFNVFYGYVAHPFNITVRGDRSKGDLKDFLRVAKAEGVRLIVIDWFDLDDDTLDLRKRNVDGIKNPDEKDRVARRNEVLESYRKYVGKTAYVSVSWLKDGVRYLYYEAEEWWNDLLDIIEEADEEAEE
jgi:hypothetical protein